MTKNENTKEGSDEFITCPTAAKITGSNPQTIKNWCRSKTTPFPHKQEAKGKPFYVKLVDVEKKLKASPNIESKFHPKGKGVSSDPIENKDSAKDLEVGELLPVTTPAGNTKPTSRSKAVRPTNQQPKKKGRRPSPKPGHVISLFNKLTLEKQYGTLAAMQDDFLKSLRNVQP